MLKRVLCLVLIALALGSFTMQQKKKIIFFGDSITEVGAKPGGYITKLQDTLVKAGKSAQFELIGAGIGGNKIYDLYFRMDSDVIVKKPDLVFIYIGINDVWHKRTYGTGSDPDKFEKFYNRIIDRIQASGAKVVICTPTTVGEKKDFVNELDGDLNKYADIIRNIARNKNVELIDLRKAMLSYLAANNSANTSNGILTLDGVHMNDKGNRFLADQFYPYIK